MEDCENWSDCELDSRARVRMVPDVTDVTVSPSSVVTELCDCSSCCSDWDFVEPQSFLPKAGLDSYAGRDEVLRFTGAKRPRLQEEE